MVCSLARDGERLGEREAAREERAPDHGALAARPPESPQVVERRDAARGEHGSPGCEHLLDQGEVRAGERAVAAPCS